MARSEPILNEDFSAYQNAIVADPAYATLPNKRSKNGNITWVRPSDAFRNKWWDGKVEELGVSNRAEAARAIHPKEFHGLKPCSICGRKLSIFYVYPSENALGRLRSEFTEEQFSSYENDIQTIIDNLELKYPDSVLGKLCRVFDISLTSVETIQSLENRLLSTRKLLSPGVMSNAGDRLDGFHTYNACCRKSMDKGRSDQNMSRYGQDRRAYENWAEGNWRGANRLMSLFAKENRKFPCPSCNNSVKLTADHVGPISLGFTHRMKFAPLCGPCNSEKNNRMYLKDVQSLVQDERAGDIVISWHSKPIWDALKIHIASELSATRASVLMRRNLHHILIILSMIMESGNKIYLQSKLHPEYAYFDYDFSYFDASSGNFKCTKKSVNSKNSQKTEGRYLRVSFESLEEYKQAINRNTKKWNNPEVDLKVAGVIEALNRNDFPFADQMIMQSIEILATDALEIFTNNSEIAEE